MDRPYVICHMTCSIDGKVTGDFLSRPESAAATELYYQLNRDYLADGFACGRVTMESSFTGGWYPQLDKYEPLEEPYASMDNMVDELTGYYAVAFDPQGRLGWQSNRIVDADEDPGYDGAQIIEVLTGKADRLYLSYLKDMDIPYIFAGEDELDVELALFKLKNMFGIETLMLEGGSILNGAFQRCGVIDELSIVQAPVIASADAKPLFTDSITGSYRLERVQNADGILWLNYKKK